ncbi:RNA pseudouridine synthase 4, mitochondrial [Malania oleifera]|uniref:RNA pseudouridine synthase 4, mitochondrial n=1 Tax=Malania oleifera TaxID=397392 RepID=UPI0025AE715B|nr:RNA pseudouridine synthase 4, mitochondrial [Malania oleifera]
MRLLPATGHHPHISRSFKPRRPFRALVHPQKMPDAVVLRSAFLRWPKAAAGVRLCISAFIERRCHYAASPSADASSDEPKSRKVKNKGEWFTLPPFAPTVNASALGRSLAVRHTDPRGDTSTATATTALKWVLRCCPQLPRSLVQKLFRLRQVRRESSNTRSDAAQANECRLRRVAAKDPMNSGDRIFLPITVQETPTEKSELPCKEEEINFIRSLVLYKDPAIIVLNKPPGMPVQGGIGIKRSLDELAACCLRYEYSEPPRLVHRLDRDSSGILVMGRTRTSAAVLHSVFHEKTFEASKDDFGSNTRILQKRYLALVIGSPKLPRGLISAPLGKVVVDSGKSERITIIGNDRPVSSQHAITEYQVIESSHGCTWLELSPRTGRKHQLRVHCAEVLGTPIVGDYKYGWQAHEKLKHFHSNNLEDNSNEMSPKGKTFAFGLHVENGSISEKHPHLHLHCKQMVLPNVSLALQNLQASSDCRLSELESLKLLAPLPPHMQRSWKILNS